MTTTSHPPADGDAILIVVSRDGMGSADEELRQKLLRVYLTMLGMSFFGRPDWANDSPEPFSGSISSGEAELLSTKTRDSSRGTRTLRDASRFLASARFPISIMRRRSRC